MEKRIFKVFLAAAVTTSASLVKADVLDNVPVMLGTGCESRIVAPESSGGYIPSGNCKTIFILPDIKGQVETVSFRPTAHALLCKAVGEYEESKYQVAVLLKKLRTQLGSASSESKRKALEKQIEDLDKQAQAGAKFLEKKPTAVAQLLFTHGVKQSDIFQWYNNNLYVAQTEGLQFTRAPIGTSTLSFTMPKADGIDEDFLISSDIPNLVKKEDSGVRTVSFNGSLSGQLVFSPFGACSLFDSVPRNLSEVSKLKLSDDNLGAYFVVNRNYEVQTLSQMSYVASVKRTEFVDIFNRFSKTRTADFKIHEFVSRDGEGRITDLVNFDLTATQLTPMQIQQWNAMKDMVMNEVALRLSTRALMNLSRLGMIAVKEEAVDEAPAAGVVYVDGTQTSCSSSSFLGVRVSGGCRTYAVKIPRNADGYAGLVDDQTVQSAIDVKETMTITQPYSYLYTSSFEPVSKK